MTISYLAEPHIHQSVPGLTDFSHVQLSCTWCHQAGGHASWIRCVQTSKLVQRRNNNNGEEHYSLCESCVTAR